MLYQTELLVVSFWTVAACSNLCHSFHRAEKPMKYHLWKTLLKEEEEEGEESHP
jgi:hypothetical protein